MRMGVIYAVVVQTWMELFGGRADTMEKVWIYLGTIEQNVPMDYVMGIPAWNQGT